MADFFTHSVFISARVIRGICSELTTFAVESPTDGVYFINEVKRAEEKNRRQEVHIRQLSLNFAV